MALILRGTKGSELTHEELDGNFTYLDAKSAAVVGYTGTAKTLALTDINTLVDCTSGSAVTITIPPQASVAWTDDAEIHVRMSGTGQVSIAVGAGVTVPPLTAPVNLTAQGAVVTLKRRSADVWALIGQTGTVVLDTDDISEGATNKYFTESRVRSSVLTGLSLLTGGVISAADSVLSALGKLQKQISDAVTAIGGKQDTLVSGTNIKTVNGSSLLGAGDLAISGSGMANPMTAFGDMIVGGASGAPERLGAGADGQVLTLVSGAAAWAAPGGGALTYITEALAAASPNNGTNAVSLSVTGGSTNADLALVPKGSGALMLHLPDATATGGNKRGQRAVDLQMNRATATQVASGNDAFAAGSNNTANVAWAVAIGYNNTSSGTASFAGGNGNTTSGSYAIALGSTNTASGSGAVAVGTQATSSGDSSFAAGNFVEANADWSIAQGYHITVRGVKGSWAYGSGPFTTRGDAQRREFVLRCSTTTATPATVATDGTPGSTLNQLTVPTNSAVKFRADVVARNSTTGDAASWAVVGLAKNVSGTVTLVGTPTATMDYNDAGASAWVLDVSADNTNKAVRFTVTGAASTNIRWVVRALSVEVVG